MATAGPQSQSIERQIRNIKAAYPDAAIVQEVFTRTRLDRPEWLKLMRRIQPGDEIVFDSVSRMSGDAKEGFAAYTHKESLFSTIGTKSSEKIF